MVGLRNVFRHLPSEAGVDGRLPESSSSKTSEEKRADSTLLPMESVQNISNPGKDNSGGPSLDERLSQSPDPEEDSQDQSVTLAATPELADAAGAPYHVFGSRMKWLVVSLIGVAGSFSGLTSSIYFPCLETITKEFHTSHQVTSFTITSYQLMQGMSPLLWGTLSDKLGRRQAYIYSLTVYVLANIVLSFSPNLPVLFAFRGLQAFGSAAVISIGSGVIQDIAAPAERGGFMSTYQALRMSSMTVGPVIGGALSQRWGFRSTFITLTILGGLVIVKIIVLLPETLRSVAGNGSLLLKGIRYKPLWVVMQEKQSDLACADEVVKQKIKPKDFWEPFRMLGDKDTLLSLALGAAVYSMWCMMTGTTTMLLAEKFDLTELLIGVAYLPNGIGTCLGSYVAGRLMDRDYRSAEASYKEARGMPAECKISPKATPSDFPIEKARLRQVFWIIGLLSVSVALYGAAFSNLPITSRLEWIAVILFLQFCIAASANMIFAINSTLLTDLYPGKGAGASAINNFARCSTSAGAVPLVHYMIKKLGTMPTFCGLGVAVLVLCVPLAIVSRTQGMKWRRDRMSRAEDRESEPKSPTGV